MGEADIFRIGRNRFVTVALVSATLMLSGCWPLIWPFVKHGLEREAARAREQRKRLGLSPPKTLLTGELRAGNSWFSVSVQVPEPTWTAEDYFYPQDNLLIATHHPSRSEIWMWARKRADNALGKGESVDKLVALRRDAQVFYRDKLATNIVETVQTIRHRRKLGTARIVEKRLVYEVEDEADYLYLRTEFLGRRLDSDWYPDEEIVQQVLYLTDLDPDPHRRSSSWIFVALLMMPEVISDDDRQKVLEVFGQLIHKTVFHQTPYGLPRRAR
jgi:hypothetical protein